MSHGQYVDTWVELCENETLITKTSSWLNLSLEPLCGDPCFKQLNYLWTRHFFISSREHFTVCCLECLFPLSFDLYSSPGLNLDATSSKHQGLSFSSASIVALTLLMCLPTNVFTCVLLCLLLLIYEPLEGRNYIKSTLQSLVPGRVLGTCKNSIKL